MPKYTNESQKIVAYLNPKGDLVINTQYEEPKKVKVSVFRKEIVPFLFTIVIGAIATITFLNGLADSIDKDAKRIKHENTVQQMAQNEEIK